MTSTAVQDMPAPPHRHVPVGRIVLAVVGTVLLLLALALGGVGGVAIWAHATQRDDDGFFTTRTERFETLTHAITSDEVDLGTRRRGRDRGFDLGDLATVRFTVDSEGERPVFVGIGPEDDVERYLDGVAHAEIDDVGFRPFRVTYDYRAGDDTPAPPGEQAFWAATAEGSGPRTLEWEPESGQWAVVVMNADGSAGVGVDASVGVKLDWVLPLGVALLVIGGILGALGAVLLVLGVVGLARRIETEPLPGPEPVRLGGHLDPALSRWLWFVKAVLLIPHFVVLVVLWTAFWVVTVVAWFSILFTGRYPRALFDFNVGVLRWTWRVGFYSFAVFGTDRYPPFTLSATPDYPAVLDVEYPQRLSRGLVLVKWWLLAIPHYVVVGIFGGGLWWAADDDAWRGPGLIGWLVLVAVVVLLFVGRYPRGIFAFVMGLNRWVFRVVVYAALMTDRYPPFRLDQGGEEPLPDGARAPE